MDAKHRAFVHVIKAGLALFFALAPSTQGWPAEALKRGTVWFQTSFDESNALSGWSGNAELVPGKQGRSIYLRSQSTTPGISLTRTWPAESLRGCVLRGTVSVRAKSVSSKPNPWNGIKCMLVIETPAGKQYPQAPLETGSFDWQSAGFSARIPPDATRLTLVLGLEQVTGEAWFDDLKLAVLRTPASEPPPVSGPRFKGHDLPRLRGTMISSSITPESLQLLGGQWNANVIRWQLTRITRPGATATEEEYDQWLETELKKLDAAVPICEKLGIRIVLDLHSPPGGKGTAGGYAGSDHRLFTDKTCQDKLVSLWRTMAARYKNAQCIWGYDLVNEPVEDDVAEDCDTWQDLATRVARAIREVDPMRTIIVEPARWGGPDGLEELVPIPVSNVVYSVHMYIPHQFTHQNVHSKTPAVSYPGVIAGKHWNKARLEEALKPAIDFQNRYNVHIYIGEFSAIRWAPDQSAFRYLNDLIEIFEAHEWDWTYHAFREWHGWSVEHDADPANTKPTSSPTDRQKLLREWFAKNRK